MLPTTARFVLPRSALDADGAAYTIPAPRQKDAAATRTTRRPRGLAVSSAAKVW